MLLACKSELEIEKREINYYVFLTIINVKVEGYEICINFYEIKGNKKKTKKKENGKRKIKK